MSLNRRLLALALLNAAAATAPPTVHETQQDAKRYHLSNLSPRLKGTPPNPNRKTKAEKKRDRKAKARAARGQADSPAPVARVEGQPAEGPSHCTDPATRPHGAELT